MTMMEVIIKCSDSCRGNTNVYGEPIKELVRCKDCIHKYVSGNGITHYHVCDFMDAQYEDDGYCSHGERRE